MSELTNILQSHSPKGESYEYYLRDIARCRLEEILVDLPRIPSLPMADEVKGIEPASPFVVEETITIAALRGHLTKAEATTPEIGIGIFQNGTQVLEVGGLNQLTTPTAWQAFQRYHAVDLHTHPNPHYTEASRQPSFADVSSKAYLDFFTVASREGLTHVQRPNGVNDSDDVHDLFWNFAHAKIGKTSIHEYGASRLYKEFNYEVVQPQFTPWDMLDNAAALSYISTAYHGSARADMASGL